MRRAKCEFENPEGMKFCGQCTNPLALICSECRFENPPGFKFCGQCTAPCYRRACECEVDASETQRDGREMPPLTEASRDATQALKKASDANKIRKSGVDVPFDPSRRLEVTIKTGGTRQRVTASRNLDGVLDGSFLRLCWKFVEQSFEGFD